MSNNSTANEALLAKERAKFHSNIVDPESGALSISTGGVASNADKSSKVSKKIAARLCAKIPKVPVRSKKLDGQTAGSRFEILVAGFVSNTFLKLDRLRPGRWSVHRDAPIYRQYEHLGHLEIAVNKDRTLRSVLGNSYEIKPDITIGRMPEPDEVINQSGRIVDDTAAKEADLRLSVNPRPLLHASISCKWTIRSDRAQNSRSEALNLIRNRKGPNPHIVVVTAEPTPSRIAALALGTGDIDCVYHFALEELVQAVKEVAGEDTFDLLQMLVEGRRLKDISSLPLDLAI